MIHYIMTAAFVVFIVITVVGFNKQMMAKKRDEKIKKKDQNESID